MKIFLLSILVTFQVSAEFVHLPPPHLRLSEAWRKFDKKRKATPEYEALKKTGNPSVGYDIDLCTKEKDFSTCDMAFCISGSRPEPTEKWLKAAVENINGTCNLPDIESDYRALLSVVKTCVNYKKLNGKAKPSCTQL